MNIVGKLAAVVFAAVLLSACGTTEQVKPSVEDQSSGTAGRAAGTEQGEGASSSALPGQAGVQGSPLDDPSSPLSKRVIYFDYDSSDVAPEWRDIVAAHAQYLASHPDAVVVLEGHTDERGTREYNLALGERRCEAVRRLLLFQGAADKQIRTISYGEERPAVEGHDEAAWSKNRRVELVYKR